MDSSLSISCVVKASAVLLGSVLHVYLLLGDLNSGLSHYNLVLKVFVCCLRSDPYMFILCWAQEFINNHKRSFSELLSIYNLPHISCFPRVSFSVTWPESWNSSYPTLPCISHKSIKVQGQAVGEERGKNVTQCYYCSSLNQRRLPSLRVLDPVAPVIALLQWDCLGARAQENREWKKRRKNQ